MLEDRGRLAIEERSKVSDALQRTKKEVEDKKIQAVQKRDDAKAHEEARKLETKKNAEALYQDQLQAAKDQFEKCKASEEFLSDPTQAPYFQEESKF